MNRKLQVFISSTHDDLVEERQAAVEAILDSGHIPAGMELFKGGNSTIATIKKWIKESDILVLILGGKYGSLPTKRKRSFTQIEYEFAISEGIPVCPIVLSDSFLFSKAAKKNNESVFEQKNPEKYKQFKEKVKAHRVASFADNVDQVKSIIVSYLNDVVHEDTPRPLVGWVRGNQVFDIDYNGLPNDQIVIGMKKIVEQLMSNNHRGLSIECAQLAASDICAYFDRIFESPYGVMKSSERDVRLELVDAENEILRVTTTKVFEYYDLDYTNHPFRVSFRANKQQATSYRTIALLINGVKRIDDLQIMHTCDPDRSQLQYRVFSNKVSLPSSDCKIVHAASYECKVDDFIQSHRINCLCRKLKVRIILDPLLREKYALTIVSFSPFSSRHDDEFEAGEIITPYDQQISLPEWSLPGSGYAITLKKK